ncbi:MAG: decaprenyl-phosphate phosphoribosyltransferase, partial [Chloroflexi bacterium]
LYGIFRYLYLVHQKGETAPPDELLLKDRPLQITVLLWGLAAAVILYLG